MIGELIRFGVVGVAAMATHWCVVASIVPLGIAPLFANVIGFASHLMSAYFGHLNWTFTSTDSQKDTFKRFLSVAVLGFVINEAMYSLLLKLHRLDYRVALAIVLVAVAALTFVLSRFWAFRLSSITLYQYDGLYRDSDLSTEKNHSLRRRLRPIRSDQRRHFAVGRAAAIVRGQLHERRRILVTGAIRCPNYRDRIDIGLHFNLTQPFANATVRAHNRCDALLRAALTGRIEQRADRSSATRQLDRFEAVLGSARISSMGISTCMFCRVFACRSCSKLAQALPPTKNRICAR